MLVIGFGINCVRRFWEAFKHCVQQRGIKLNGDAVSLAADEHSKGLLRVIAYSHSLELIFALSWLVLRLYIIHSVYSVRFDLMVGIIIAYQIMIAICRG